MNESKIVKRIHELSLCNKNYKIAIDATVGNGYDTLFLSEHYEQVIGIDIQPLAIKRTKEKTLNCENVKLFLDDFNNINKYRIANLIIFNLGFLPGSNRKVKTQDYTSENAILNALSILDGMLLVACYIQHEGGYEEYLKIIETLNKNNITFTLEDDFDNKEKLIIISKRMA